MELYKIRYGGTAETENGTFRYRKAFADDAGCLGRMYEACAIHCRNFRTRLGEGHPEAFDKKGGMYVTLTEEEIRREIKNPHSLWAVICGPDKTVAGSFWISERNKSVPPYFMKEKTACPREIIVRGDYAGMHIGRILYYTVFRALVRAGYDRSVCEVYRALACRDAQRLYKTDMLNKPSYIDMLSLGGIYEGTAPVKEIRLEGLTVWVEPHIFSFSHKKTIALEEGEMKEAGIKITEDGDGED